MNDLSMHMNKFLRSGGADLVAFGDISELPAQDRHGMPVGISVAIKYPADVIRGIHDMPTKAYRAYYDSINNQLDQLVTAAASELHKMGHQALAQTREFVGSWEPRLGTTLPHKTIATRAGLGWIGKSALLVTKTYGSAIRLSSVLTDAPLTTACSNDASQCGSCSVCTNACPGKAVKGVNWRKGLARDVYFDVLACRDEARRRSLSVFGEDVTICGKCIEVCPYTQAYLNRAEV